MKLAKAAGIAEDKIILDPGVGFGKTYEMNLETIHYMERFHSLGYPMLSWNLQKVCYRSYAFSSGRPESRGNACDDGDGCNEKICLCARSRCKGECQSNQNDRSDSFGRDRAEAVMRMEDLWIKYR